MQGLKDHDLTPGLDMALVGFDNVQEAAMYTPPLTTVNSFARRIGTESASLLHQRISNNEEDKKRIILQPELVVRESTKLELQRD